VKTRQDTSLSRHPNNNLDGRLQRGTNRYRTSHMSRRKLILCTQQARSHKEKRRKAWRVKYLYKWNMPSSNRPRYKEKWGPSTGHPTSHSNGKRSVSPEFSKSKNPKGTSGPDRTQKPFLTSTTSRGAHRIPLGFHVSTRRTQSKVDSLQPKTGPLHTHVPHHGCRLDGWVPSCLNSQLHSYVLINEIHTSAQIRFRDPLIMCI
jgi:hypothetical protein